MKVRILLVFIAFIAVLGFTEAQPRYRDRGISPREARILRHQKKAFATNRSIAMADGRISPAERRLLQKERRKMHRRAVRLHRN